MVRYLHKLGEYDKEQLLKARALICNVYEHHYGDSYMRKETERFETIISKLDSLIQSITD